jgi:hypothetical protein
LAWLLDHIECQLLFLSAGDRAPHGLHIVGIDAGFGAGLGERDVQLSLVDQISAARAVDIDDDTINCGALAGV